MRKGQNRCGFLPLFLFFWGGVCGVNRIRTVYSGVSVEFRFRTVMADGILLAHARGCCATFEFFN
jgi:hypothetical protein